MVRRRAELWVRARSLQLLVLGGCRRNVAFASRSFLLRGRPRVNSAVAAVITDAVRPVARVDNGRVVDVVYLSNVYVGHGPVVEEVPTIPSPTNESFSGVTEAVINSSVEADLWAPIALIESECSVDPGPIRRRP